MAKDYISILAMSNINEYNTQAGIVTRSIPAAAVNNAMNILQMDTDRTVIARVVIMPDRVLIINDTAGAPSVEVAVVIPLSICNGEYF